MPIGCKVTLRRERMYEFLDRLVTIALPRVRDFRGLQGQEVRGNANVVNAYVPLANMFKYVDTLRSMSQGRAQFTMQFDHYEPVPQAISEEIQAKYA